MQKRFILTLLLRDGLFANSNQFCLQSVGNIETIVQYLNFEAIDELVILDVSRGEKNVDRFADHIRQITRECFVPITAGGGVRTVGDFKKLLNSGADKICINTRAFEQPPFIGHAAQVYGSQCVVVSIDGRKQADGSYQVVVDNGRTTTGKDVVTWAKQVESHGAGEIFLTSIDHDGMAQGYDLGLLRQVADAVNIPVIASGGVGEFQHLVDGVVEGNASAVSLANLFHFIGYDGLKKAREYVETSGIDVTPALWNFDSRTSPRR